MPVHLSKADQEALLATAAEVTASAGFHADAVAFGARRDKEQGLCAVGVFQSFAGGEAEWHFGMLSGRVSRDVMRSFLTLAFHPRFLGLRRVFAPIPESNVVAQRAALAVGFKFEFRKRGGAAGGEDAIVFSMAPEELGLAAAKAPEPMKHQF